MRHRHAVPERRRLRVAPARPVDCLLCGLSNTPEGRASARRRVKRDPRIAESLDARAARMAPSVRRTQHDPADPLALALAVFIWVVAPGSLTGAWHMP